MVTFIDRDPNSTRQFVEIVSEDGVSIRATPAHLILLAAEGGWRSVFAAEVKIGDYLLVTGKDGTKRSRVVSTQVVLRRGVFAPLTTAGTLLVDGALASCYALVNSHTLAHAAMWPLRWAGSLHWFSSSSSPRGVHWFARTLYSAADYVLPAGYSYH